MKILFLFFILPLLIGAMTSSYSRKRKSVYNPQASASTESYNERLPSYIVTNKTEFGRRPIKGQHGKIFGLTSIAQNQRAEANDLFDFERSLEDVMNSNEEVKISTMSCMSFSLPWIKLSDPTPHATPGSASPSLTSTSATASPVLAPTVLPPGINQPPTTPPTHQNFLENDASQKIARIPENEVRCSDGSALDPVHEELITFSYFYQVETKDDDHQFVKALEKALLNNVGSAVLFCSGGVKKRALASAWNLETGVLAVSSLPGDEISTICKIRKHVILYFCYNVTHAVLTLKAYFVFDIDTCTAKLHNARHCYIVSGAMTLITQGGNRESDEKYVSDSLRAIQSFLNSLVLEDNILAVKYIGAKPPMPTTISKVMEDERSSDFEDMSPTAIVAVTVTGALIAFAVLYIGARRLCKSNHENAANLNKLNGNYSVPSMTYETAIITPSCPDVDDRSMLSSQCHILPYYFKPFHQEKHSTSSENEDCDWSLPAISVYGSYLDDVPEETHSSDHSSDCNHSI